MRRNTPFFRILLACLERYLRNTVVQIVHRKSTGAISYDTVANTLGPRNLVLTGRLLATLDTPRDHLILNVEELIENLASCKRGSGEFKLNAIAFSSVLEGVNPSAVEKAFDNLDISGWWDKIGADAKIVAILGTKGPRATGHRARERLRELARLRNHLAHGGDGELLISESQISDAIEFVGAFGFAFNTVIG